MSDTTDTAPPMDPATAEWFELMKRDEPLHPDLQRCVCDGPLGPTLKHPLLYSMTLHGPAVLNKRYEAKVDASAKAFHEAEWMQYIWLHERPYRLEALMRVADKLDDREYWEMVRDVWVDSENIWQNVEEWLDVLQADIPGRQHFMTADERKLFRALPDPVVAYRGCYQDLNDDAPSWTLDRDRALWFAKRYKSLDAHSEHTAVVITANIPKSAILGYIPNSRGEEEVVVRDLAEIRATRIDEI